MLLQADAALIPLKDNSVHCVVTSPPYWGLRKYTGEQGRGEYPNLGLEPTPELHIQHIVEIFREVKRVLRDDGVVWLNYGDCYAAQGIKKHGSWDGQNKNPDGSPRASRITGHEISGYMDMNIPQGNLMLMPHRVAIALQDDRWIVRNDLIWFKRNPMPESCAGWRFEGKACDCMYERREELVALNEAKGIPRHRTATIKAGDVPPNPNCSRCNGTGKVGNPILKKGSWRHTRAHEYIFQLVKSRKGGMKYWCNQEAVRETIIPDPRDLQWGKTLVTSRHDHSEDAVKGMSQIRTQDDGFVRMSNPSGRNPRTVLDVPTSPYKGAHYATFPPNLIAPLIRASCPRRACPECGQGWAAVVEKKQPPVEIRPKTSSPRDGIVNIGFDKDGIKYGSGQAVQDWLNKNPPIIKAYRPTCECGHEDYVPGVVLDPFIGSGTTGAVARELQRRWIGLDISMEYLDQQAKIRALNLTPSNALDELPLFNL